MPRAHTTRASACFPMAVMSSRSTRPAPPSCSASMRARKSILFIGSVFAKRLETAWVQRPNSEHGLTRKGPIWFFATTPVIFKITTTSTRRKVCSCKRSTEICEPHGICVSACRIAYFDLSYPGITEAKLKELESEIEDIYLPDILDKCDHARAGRDAACRHAPMQTADAAAVVTKRASGEPRTCSESGTVRL